MIDYEFKFKVLTLDRKRVPHAIDWARRTTSSQSQTWAEEQDLYCDVPGMRRVGGLQCVAARKPFAVGVLPRNAHL
jgi:hypothetical protein